MIVFDYTAQPLCEMYSDHLCKSLTYFNRMFCKLGGMGVVSSHSALL